MLSVTMIDKLNGCRVGADKNEYVIEALQVIRDRVDYLPKSNKEFTESDYLELYKSNGIWFKGYAGFAFSYSGKWLGGWCRDGANKRDYVREAFNNAKKQSPLLQGVTLVHRSYEDLNIPDNSLIYCDPPYEGATSYKDKFDHSRFWSW